MDYITELQFCAMVDALGANATEKQAENLVSWIVENIGMDYWNWAAEYAILVPGVYTDIRMRMAECGQY